MVRAWRHDGDTARRVSEDSTLCQPEPISADSDLDTPFNAYDSVLRYIADRLALLLTYDVVPTRRAPVFTTLWDARAWWCRRCERRYQKSCASG